MALPLARIGLVAMILAGVGGGLGIAAHGRHSDRRSLELTSYTSNVIDGNASDVNYQTYPSLVLLNSTGGADLNDFADMQAFAAKDVNDSGALFVLCPRHGCPIVGHAVDGQNGGGGNKKMERDVETEKKAGEDVKDQGPVIRYCLPGDGGCPTVNVNDVSQYLKGQQRGGGNKNVERDAETKRGVGVLTGFPDVSDTGILSGALNFALDDVFPSLVNVTSNVITGNVTGTWLAINPFLASPELEEAYDVLFGVVQAANGLSSRLGQMGNATAGNNFTLEALLTRVGVLGKGDMPGSLVDVTLEYLLQETRAWIADHK